MKPKFKVVLIREHAFSRDVIKELELSDLNAARHWAHDMVIHGSFSLQTRIDAVIFQSIYTASKDGIRWLELETIKGGK